MPAVLGSNHQEGSWTFSSTVEKQHGSQAVNNSKVTNNTRYWPQSKWRGCVLCSWNSCTYKYLKRGGTRLCPSFSQEFTRFCRNYLKFLLTHLWKFIPILPLFVILGIKPRACVWWVGTLPLRYIATPALWQHIETKDLSCHSLHKIVYKTCMIF